MLTKIRDFSIFAFAALFCAGAQFAHGQNSILSIQNGIGGTIAPYATSVSDNGYVAGTADNGDGNLHAFLWSLGSGMTDLGATNDNVSSGLGISGDGSVVAGRSGDPTQHATVWTSGTGMVDLPTPGGVKSLSNGISRNGQVVAGQVAVTGGFANAALWTIGGSMTNLGTLAGGSNSTAGATNASGTLAVGFSEKGSSVVHAFSWTSGGGMVQLDSDDAFNSSAGDVSDDGLLIAGAQEDSNGTHAVLWNNGVEQSLGVGDSSDALTISGNGLLVGGSSSDLSGAFLWDSGHGARGLGDVLTAEGVDFTGWSSFGDVVSIGSDGTDYYLVGHGTYNGDDASYFATLSTTVVPEPSALALIGIGLAAGFVFWRRRGATA